MEQQMEFEFKEMKNKVNYLLRTSNEIIKAINPIVERFEQQLRFEQEQERIQQQHPMGGLNPYQDVENNYIEQPISNENPRYNIQTERDKLLVQNQIDTLRFKEEEQLRNYREIALNAEMEKKRMEQELALLKTKQLGRQTGTAQDLPIVNPEIPIPPKENLVMPDPEAKKRRFFGR